MAPAIGGDFRSDYYGERENCPPPLIIIAILIHKRAGFFVRKINNARIGHEKRGGVKISE
jgi:hypothetical protein